MHGELAASYRSIVEGSPLYSNHGLFKTSRSPYSIRAYTCMYVYIYIYIYITIIIVIITIFITINIIIIIIIII